MADNENPHDVAQDLSFGSYMRRIEAQLALLISRGGFSGIAALAALLDADANSKEDVAGWLRSEFSSLRVEENAVGESPILAGGRIPRPEITDLTMTMVECCEERPGHNLTCLLGELLNTDMHRSRISHSRAENYEKAASTEAVSLREGKTLGIRALARIVGTDPTNILRWRKETRYQELVESYKSISVGVFHSEKMIND